MEFQVLPQLTLSSSSSCWVLWLPPTTKSCFGLICRPVHKQAQKYLATTTPKKSMPSHSSGCPGQCCSKPAWCWIDTIIVGKNKTTPLSDLRTRDVGTVGRRVERMKCGMEARENFIKLLLDSQQWQLLWSYCPRVPQTQMHCGMYLITMLH